MGRLRSILLHTALVLFGLGIGLVLAEIGVRVAGLGRPATLAPFYDRSHAVYLSAESRAHPWTTGKDDYLKVAVIGDSFTVGEGNHGFDAYPARLERMLNLNDGERPVEVRAFAAKGTATVKQLGFLARALTWQPDLIVLGIYMNDTEDPEDRTLKARRAQMMPRQPEGLWAALLRNVKTFGLVYQRIETRRCQRAGSAYTRYLFDPAYPGWQKFDDALLRFARRTRARDIPLLAVVFPTMGHLDQDYPQTFAHEQVNEALTKHGIRHLDLLPTFRGTSDLRMAVFPSIDAHPSEIAHRLAAETIFHHLLDTGLIDPSYRPRQGYIETSREKWLERVQRMQSVVFR